MTTGDPSTSPANVRLSALTARGFTVRAAEEHRAHLALALALASGGGSLEARVLG